MFRKQTDITDRLYTSKKYLYLKTDRDNFNIENVRNIYNSIIRQIENHEPVKLILDVKPITMVDSVSVKMLISVKNKCSIINCELILLNTDDIILRTFKLLGISNFFTIIESLEDIDKQ